MHASPFLLALGILSVTAQQQDTPQLPDAQSALEQAVRDNSAQAIDAALASGARLNRINNAGQTAILVAVALGQIEALVHLLMLKADTKIPDRGGYRLMQVAAHNGRAAAIPILAGAGLDPSERHGDGYTPIHRASLGRTEAHTETVRALLEAGVPFDEPVAGNGLQPSDLSMGNPNTQKLLDHWKQKARAPGSSPKPRDKSDKCPRWASSGECDKNPRYMKLECPVSCANTVEERVEL